MSTVANWRKAMNMRAAVLVALLWPIFPASAAEIDGNLLLQDCNEATASFGFGYCAGYVAGVAHLVSVESYEGSTYFWKSCPPKAATTEQLVDVVKKFLNEHPEDRHRPALLLVLKALSNAFPCQQ